MTNEEKRAFAESYWQAEAARDVAGVLHHYAEDAVFIPNGRRLVGHEQIRQFYEESGAQYPGLRVRIAGEHHADSFSTFEWEAELTNKSGASFPLRGVNVVRMGNGKFAEVHAYFDTSTLPAGASI